MRHRSSKRHVYIPAVGVGAAIALTLALWPREMRGDPPLPTAIACEVADVGLAKAACPPGGGGPPPPGLPPGPGCADLGAECGEVADGRGGVLQCGECAAPLECNVKRANKCDDPPPDGPACIEQEPEETTAMAPPEVFQQAQWLDGVATSAVCKMIGGALGLPLGDRTGYAFDIRKDKVRTINNRLCTETTTATTSVNQADAMICGLGIRFTDSSFSDSDILTRCKDCPQEIIIGDPDDPPMPGAGAPGVWVCDGDRCHTTTSDNSFNFQAVYSFPSIKLFDVLTMNASLSAGARVDWWNKETVPGTTDKCPTCQRCDIEGWRAGPSLGGQLVIDAGTKQPWWLRWLGLQGSIDLQLSVQAGKESQHGQGAGCPDKECMTVKAQGSVTSRLHVTGRMLRGIKLLTTLLNFKCQGAVEWDDCGGGLRWNPTPSCNFI